MMTELETSRLLVRRLSNKDIDRVLMIRGDRGIAEATGDRMVLSREEAEGHVRSADAMAISEKEGDGSAIGLLVLYRYGEDCGSVTLRCCDFCYSLLPAYRGHGYMTEIVEAVCFHLFETERIDRLGISVFSWNDASRNVALKNGFSLIPEMTDTVMTKLGKKEEMEWYFLTRNVYMASRGLRVDWEPMVRYGDAVASGTAADVALARNAVLSGLRELDPGEYRKFLMPKPFPGSIYRTADVSGLLDKVRLLRSFGYGIKDALWNMADCLLSDTSSGCAAMAVPLLVAEGADVNFVREGRSPLDLLSGRFDDIAAILEASGALHAAGTSA